MRIRKIMRGAFYTNGQQTSFEAGDLTPTSIDIDWWIYYTDENDDDWKIAPTGTTYATTTPVLVDSTTTSITVTPTTISDFTTETYQLAVVNQDSVNVLAECTFTSSDDVVATGSSSGLVTILYTGTTIITTTHNDGPTGATSVFGYFSGPVSLTPTAQDVITGTTLQFSLSDDGHGTDITDDAVWTSVINGATSTGITIDQSGLATIVADADHASVHTITATYPRGSTGTQYAPETELTVRSS